MSKHDSFTLLAVLCLIALPAQATIYVSGVGNDTNPCSISQPCREISHALTVVATAGQIVVSGAGDFQPITVTKSVSVVAPDGIHASIASSASTPITISVGTTDNVLISGLDLSTSGSVSTTVLNEGAGGWITIDNCIVRNATQGIFNISAGGRVFIKNTTITANSGLGVIAQSGQTLIEHSTIQTAGSGGGAVLVDSGAKVVIRDSVLAGNSSGTGIGSGGSTTVDHCLIANQGNGIQGGSVGTVITVSNSTFSYNSFGLVPGCGPILSLANNVFIGNSTDGSFTGTVGFK